MTNVNTEISITPLHLACRLSNEDAVKYLVERQGFEVNVLLNEKSILYELLSTAQY